MAKRLRYDWKSINHEIKDPSASQLCHMLAGSLWWGGGGAGGLYLLASTFSSLSMLIQSC